MKPGTRKLNDRRYRNGLCALRRYHRLADQFTRLGLTSRGKPRRRSANRPLAVRRELERARSLARWRTRAAQFRAAGLTTRGTRRKLQRRGLPLVEAAYRAFRESLRIQPPDFHWSAIGREDLAV